MSWLTNRDLQNSGNYRYIQFEGGRILQAAELNDLQSEASARKRYASASMFVDGALANVKAVIAGNGITLSKTVPAEPWMMVLINGEWEPFNQTTLLLPAVKVTGLDTLYLHWTLWKVTADGAAGSLADPALVDGVTNEAVAERGQLQFTFSFTTALSDEAIDPARMISKSTVAIPVLQIAWEASTPSIVTLDIFRAHMLGTPSQAGVVKLSTSTSNGVAVADDDARLAGAGTADASIRTRHVTLPEETGNTTTIQTPEVKTGANDGGIDAARVWYAPLKAKVSDVLTYLAAGLAALSATAAAHAARLTALEGRSTGSLAGHVGKALGRDADGSFTHSPIVTDPMDGYKHIGTQSPEAGQNSLTESKPAYMAWTRDGNKVGGIVQNGDYVLLNPGLVNQINGLCPGGELNSYFKLALTVGQLTIAVRDLQNR